MQTLVLIVWSFLFVFLLIPNCKAIACYKCQSRNGLDKACESGSSGAGYETSCKYRPVGRQSYFSGEYCIKVKGRLVPSRETIVIRDCDERPFNRNQATLFMFKGLNINGTQYSCKTDYCNRSLRLRPISMVTFLSIIFGLILFSGQRWI